jgi:hypothetical protein
LEAEIKYFRKNNKRLANNQIKCIQEQIDIKPLQVFSCKVSGPKQA